MFKPLILFALLLGPPSPKVALAVSPHFVSMRDPVRAIITIEADDRNREACLSWEGESELGSHCWEHLEEKDFPSHIEYPVRLHTLGVFEFQLSVRRTDKIVRTALQEVEVH